ncbi:MAG: hypothetical protein IPJ11_06285 [Gemmatimonadetes bacterium]|nr:hypothetical protein [Gemmatimonadota bacterium]
MTTFYAELAQMTVLHQESSHAVLAIDGLEVVIHALPPQADRDHAARTTIVVREDSHWKLCLPVVSILHARDVAGALGGAIRSAEHEWVARGFRACDGHDPEGNVLQVRETAS